MSSGHDEGGASPITKILTIIGFIATIGLLVWLVITAFSLAPGGFSSLATSVENRENYKPADALKITLPEDVVNTGASVTLSWTDMKQEGEHAFTYSCVPGVTLLVQSADTGLVPMGCDDTLTLPANVHELTFVVRSSEQRFSEVLLTVVFTNADAKVFTDEAKLSIMNASLPTRNEEVATPAPSKTTTERPRVETPRSTQTAPRTPTPTVTQVYPYSNPNGYVDLHMSEITIGYLKHGVFVKTDEFDVDRANALQFTVKNIGTKTSGSWTYTLDLPEDTYHSPKQDSLKPQEFEVFTVGFDAGRSDRSITIEASLDAVNDVNNSNNDDTVRASVED